MSVSVRCLIRSRGPSGEPVPRLGMPLVDDYLEFLEGRCRPNTVLAAGYDLGVFFCVVGKPAEQVRAADVLGFIAAQRTGRRDAAIVQPVDVGEQAAGVAVSTVARRLSIISGFFACLQARGDIDANPVPRGLPTRRERSRPGQGVPLTRRARKLPRILTPPEAGKLAGALRTHRDRAMAAAPWLHVPAGKLREDRYLPLHPQLVQLIDAYRTAHVPPGHPLLLPRENGRPADRHSVTRILNNVAATAGLGHIHPHQLRHTLATQAINRGMSLEAIAAMPGHRSLDMTLRYAKIANRTVADEYFAVTDQVDALYAQARELPADAIGPKMARLRREHHRLLGNGFCTRPAELDCAFEAICETCSFFQTSIEFRPTLQAQHDDAASKGQDHRATLFGQLLTGLAKGEAS
jgi:integrase